MAVSDLAGGAYSNYTPAGEQVSAHGETIGLQSEMWGAKRWQTWRRPGLEETDSAGEEFSSGTAPSAAPVRRIEPRLGLLFLTRGDVNLPEIWRDFASQAGESARVFSHPKDQLAAARGFLAGTAIPEWHETAWGDISLVRAMLDLLRNALADESLTHFVFLSESCIPIRPWHELARALATDPRSMIAYEDSREMQPKHLERISRAEDLPGHARRLHPQWCLLDREAATCASEVDLTCHFADVFAADEHYWGSVLALRGFPDERLRRQTPTWVKWEDSGRKGGPREINQVTGSLVRELAGFPGFFARKFLPGSDIARWGLHRP